MVPKSYRNLCLNVLLAGVNVMLILDPIVIVVAANTGVVALAMVGKSQEPLPVELYAPEYSNAPPQDALNEPLPLESCFITVVPLNGFVPLYVVCQSELVFVVPYTVTYFSLTMVNLSSLAPPAAFSDQDIVDVLFATLWLVKFHENT
jgi:hypothetical protein